MRGAGKGSGWHPLRELPLREGDVIVFKYECDPDMTAARIEAGPGGFLAAEEPKGFSSPEEIALEMEARGNPGRVLLLNFVPWYWELEGSGNLRPTFGETGLAWREIR